MPWSWMEQDCDLSFFCGTAHPYEATDVEGVHREQRGSRLCPPTEGSAGGYIDQLKTRVERKDRVLHTALGFDDSVVAQHGLTLTRAASREEFCGGALHMLGEHPALPTRFQAQRQRS